MDLYEYWIGKDIDLENIWQAFDEGKGHIEKYRSSYRSNKIYMLRLHFEKYSLSEPLFDHEAVLKTIKSLFHDLKKECLTESEYNNLGPIFLFEVNRGSSIYTFLAESLPLIMLALYLRERLLEIEGKKLNNQKAKIDIIKSISPNAEAQDVYKYSKAWTPIGINKIVKKLGLKKVEMSKRPFRGNINIETKVIFDISAQEK